MLEAPRTKWYGTALRETAPISIKIGPVKSSGPRPIWKIGAKLVRDGPMLLRPETCNVRRTRDGLHGNEWTKDVRNVSEWISMSQGKSKRQVSCDLHSLCPSYVAGFPLIAFWLKMWWRQDRWEWSTREVPTGHKNSVPNWPSTNQTMPEQKLRKGWLQITCANCKDLSKRLNRL